MNVAANTPQRQASCGQEGVLTLSLSGGILKDAQGRTGYIADNYQFQFDAPPQTGALSTAGYSICTNASAANGDSSVKFLTLGSSTDFYQCLSGNFYNLYDRSWAPQCSPVAIQVLPCPGASGGPTPTATGSAAPGSTTVTLSGTTMAMPATAAPDGQPQASSAQPYSPPVVTVIADGQPQAQSAIPLSQMSDGQPNMPTALVSQLGDGQPIATSAAPVATTPAPSQAPISQIGDGQPQAGNATVLATPSPTIFTGGAALPTAVQAAFGVVAGVVAVAML